MSGAIRRYAILTAACLAYAVIFNWFFAETNIAFGGITGIAHIVNTLFGAPPVGVFIIIANIPIFLLGLRFLGWQVLVSSLFSMAVSSIFIDLTAMVVHFPPMEPLLAALCGGTCIGVALGVIFAQNATTGGSDLAARLIKLRLPWMSIGRVLMVLDLIVITLYALVFRNLNTALYGVVALLVSAKGVDMVLYGMDTARVAYIISERSDEIAAAILSDMGRGVTMLDGHGAWSGARKQVLFVAFKQRQIVDLRRIVKDMDSNAFLIVCEAHEVLGEGFRKHTETNI